MWCPLVLLVKISWGQVGRSEKKENKEMGSEQFEYRAEEEAELLGGILSFLFRGFPA